MLDTFSIINIKKGERRSHITSWMSRKKKDIPPVKAI